MNGLAIAWRKWTKYSIPATFPLALAGLVLIMLTFPNPFYAISRSGLPAGMSFMLEGIYSVTAPLLKQQKAIAGSANLYLAIALPFLVWALVGAGLIRSARARSWAPALSMSVNLGLGVLAFPLFAWIAQIAVWVIGFGGLIAGWVSSLLANGIVRAIGMVAGGLLVLAIVVVLVVWAAQSTPGRWAIGIVAVGACVIWVTKDSIASRLAPLLSAIWQAVLPALGVIAEVIGVAIVVIVAIVAWLIAILVFAYLGGNMITPIRDSLKAGREAGAFADVAAGVGIAVSTLITAASYSEAGTQGFAHTLLEAARTRVSLPMGSLPNVLDLRFDAIMPHAFDPLLRTLFAGFNGTPDLLLVAIVCALAALGLIQAAGPIRSMEDAPATILTFAFLRVLLLAAGTIIALWLTADDSGG